MLVLASIRRPDPQQSKNIVGLCWSIREIGDEQFTIQASSPHTFPHVHLGPEDNGCTKAAKSEHDILAAQHVYSPQLSPPNIN